MIVVNRIGFPGSDARSVLTPEVKMQEALREMQEQGHKIISASVLASPRDDETYEVYIVSDDDHVLKRQE